MFTLFILHVLFGVGSCIDVETLISNRNIINKKGDYPWMASIQVTNFQEGWHICGGALISTRWVLTAAHCLDHEKPEWLWIVLGARNLNLPDGSEQYIEVSSFLKHPQYDYTRRPQPNDIGLVALKTPAELNDFVQLLGLPVANEEFKGECIEVGWGAHSNYGGMTSQLNSVKVPLLEQAECKSKYPMSTPHSTLCAGYLAGGIGACEGDNGGPVMCENRDRVMTAAGVLSYRQGCALKGFPAVYTSITYHLRWILSIIRYN